MGVSTSKKPLPSKYARISFKMRERFINVSFTSGFMIADTTGHIIYDLDFKQFTVSQSPHAEELLQLGKAILQRTSSDLKHR